MNEIFCRKLNAIISKRSKIKLSSEKIPIQNSQNFSTSNVGKHAENRAIFLQLFVDPFSLTDTILISALINWKQQISTTIPSAAHAEQNKNKKKWHVLGTQTNLDWRWKKLFDFRAKTFKISWDFFCEFRIKVPSKSQFLWSRSVCSSELSQSWACAERGEKWVSDLRAGLRKRNKSKSFFNFQLSFGKRDQSTAEVKTKIVWNTEVQLRQVSWNSWAKKTLSWSWRIIKKRVIACCLSENIGRSIWLKANWKKMRKEKWELYEQKLKSTKLW
jgi:hypothetical protein